MGATAELGRNPVTKHQISLNNIKIMSRLTRDGTAEPVSRDQFLRRELNAEREIFIFPVQLMTTRRIGNLTRLIHTLAVCVTILEERYQSVRSSRINYSNDIDQCQNGSSNNLLTLYREHFCYVDAP